MTIDDLLKAENVHLAVRASGKTPLLHALAALAAKTSALDVEAIVTAIEHREALGSTGVGKGLALPHARIVGLRAPIVLLARLKTAIRFDAIDDRPVDIVAFALLPDTIDDNNVLACLARALRDETVLARLRTAHDPTDILSVLTARRP